jgi:hypothetical protein
LRYICSICTAEKDVKTGKQKRAAPFFAENSRKRSIAKQSEASVIDGAAKTIAGQEQTSPLRPVRLGMTISAVLEDATEDATTARGFPNFDKGADEELFVDVDVAGDVPAFLSESLITGLEKEAQQEQEEQGHEDAQEQRGGEEDASDTLHDVSAVDLDREFPNKIVSGRSKR